MGRVVFTTPYKNGYSSGLIVSQTNPIPANASYLKTTKFMADGYDGGTTNLSPLFILIYYV